MADSSDLPKKYVYKIFSPTGTFKGVLQDVKSPFKYNQLIGTSFAQLTVVVAQTADTSSQDVEILETENNLPITTEAGLPITTERVPDLVGSGNSNALISNDNLIEVWEYSHYNPNGKLVFSGYIAKWRVKFGGSEDVEATCLSKGVDLKDDLVPGGVEDTLDQSQTSQNNWWPVYETPPDNTYYAIIVGGNVGTSSRVGQRYMTGSVSNLSAIKLALAVESSSRPMAVTLTVFDTGLTSIPNGTPLTIVGVTSTVVSNTVAADITFRFSSPLTVSPSKSYLFVLSAVNQNPSAGNGSLLVYYRDSNVYSNGVMYAYSYNFSGVPQSLVEETGWDIYFKTYYSVNSTKKTYSSVDVADILNDIMDSYVSSGGAVAKSGTYPATGKTASYIFNINTVLEGIQKVFELGPSNYYWYVDPATNILYYQAAGTTADHYLIKGRHIKELDIEATKEYIINNVYFTGGDDGTGSNVYVNLTDQDSLIVNRRGLARINDPKVTGASGADTGRILAQNIIDTNNSEVYITQVTVTDDTYDISLFTIGQMVGFEGFGTFVDRLLLQIVGINREEDQVTLSLGTLRKRSTAQVEKIQSSLEATQTVDNPVSPS